jgi:hypothetical protein
MVPTRSSCAWPTGASSRPSWLVRMPRPISPYCAFDADEPADPEFRRIQSAAPGEWVIAIGSPFQFEQSVTAGIVSAKGRTQGPAAVRSVHPDRRGHQSRQLRWAADPNRRQCGRDQLLDSQFARRQHRPVVCHSGRGGQSSVEQLIEYGRVVRGYLGVGIGASAARRPMRSTSIGQPARWSTGSSPVARPSAPDRGRRCHPALQRHAVDAFR